MKLEIISRFEDPLLTPVSTMHEGKLFVQFSKTEDLSDEEYRCRLYETYFAVLNYRPKKPIVMYDLGRGTYTSAKEILAYVHERISKFRRDGL